MRVENPALCKIGSGVLIAREIGPPIPYRGGSVVKARSFLVTNKHLIGESPKERQDAHILVGVSQYSSSYVGLQPLQFEVQLNSDNYCEYPDDDIDIAAIEIDDRPTERLYQMSVFYSELADDAEFTKSVIMAGDDVIIAGYPDGLTGEANRPLLRRGMIATNPRITTQNRVDEAPPDLPLRSHFLIDGGVFEGSSGSAVYLDEPEMRIRDELTARILVVGIVFSHRRSDGEAHRPHVGLGFVHPSPYIRKTIDLFFDGEPQPEFT